MSEPAEQFRLVFSGEVLDGQHPAVVKKRLGAVLKLDDARMDKLFSGKPVVVKKSADSGNAAKYQRAFQKAGARLRVLPVAGEAPAPTEPVPPTTTPPTPPPAAKAAPPPPAVPRTEGDMSVMPVGSDILADSERAPEQTADIDTSHLTTQDGAGRAVFITADTMAEEAGPNVDHISLAELGSQIGRADPDLDTAEIDVDFDLAEVGAVLGQLARQEATAPVPDVDFDVAEVGVDLNQIPEDTPPPAPDTSHLDIDP